MKLYIIIVIIIIITISLRVQELCESRGGRPGLPVLMSLIMIIMYIYHALINALSAHMIYINLNMIFYTNVEHSPTNTIYIIIPKKTHYKHTRAHTHTHTHTHTHKMTVAETGYWY